MSRIDLLNKWIKDVYDKTLIRNGEKIVCEACNRNVIAKKKFQLRQHFSTKVHQHKISSHVQHEEEQGTNFCYEMCEAMVAANIPWNTLHNNSWRSFLEKYTQRSIPNESTLRKTYLKKCYEDVVNEIRSDIGSNYIWVSVDETTDRCGRYIANFIVGKMCANESSKSHLLCCKELERTDHASIARFVNTSVLKLWPDSDNSEKILLMVTDAAPYMVKAAKHLNVFYPNLKHLTCLAHGVHRAAEKVRMIFPEVNNFISSTKKVFLKSPSRIMVYKQIMDDVPLPPNPVITRWGTWIEAAIFYAENYQKIKEVLEQLDPTEAESIRSAKEAIEDPRLLTALIYIQQHYECIPRSLKKLEEHGMRLTEAMEIVTELRNSLEIVPAKDGLSVADKFKMILRKNSFFKDLEELCSLFKDPKWDITKIPIKPELLSKYAYAPITSCDVERSFSSYKQIFGEKRHRLTVENLEQILVIYCNK